jgi:hypothetical protein
VSCSSPSRKRPASPNWVVWPSLFERQPRVVLSAGMMAVRGKIQREGAVVHLVAHHLTDLSEDLASVGERTAAFRSRTVAATRSGRRQLRTRPQGPAAERAPLKIVRPETVIRWHRAGFRAYWRWKSRPRGGRPKTPLEIRHLIREMSLANPLWGAPRIHGELLKLGIDVGQTTVATYMARGRRPPSQGWKTFLDNHADGIASMDLFVVPTLSFRLLYGLLILQHDRRQILWLGVTAHPTAEWISRQLTCARCGAGAWIRSPSGANAFRESRRGR